MTVSGTSYCFANLVLSLESIIQLPVDIVLRANAQSPATRGQTALAHRLRVHLSTAARGRSEEKAT